MSLASHVSVSAVKGFLQKVGPYDVTLVNRQHHKGRSIVNTADIMNRMEAMPAVANVKYALHCLDLAWTTRPTSLCHVMPCPALPCPALPHPVPLHS